MLRNYSFVLSKERILTEIGKIIFTGPIDSLYNVSAGKKAYVITASQPLQTERMEWGLIPEWSKDGVNNGNLLSVRAEGISSKTSFRIPVRRRRCLVLADSFYVWNKEHIPYRVAKRDGTLMCFAGVWELWTQGQQEKKSFSIVTCPSNKELFGYDARMPVLLETAEGRDTWLFSQELSEALSILQTSENAIFNIYRVTNKLEDPSFNKSEIHATVPDIKTLFD